MRRVKKSFLIFVLLFNLVACAQTSTLTLEAINPAPAETATSYMAGTQTAPAISLLPTLSFSTTLLPTITPLVSLTPTNTPTALALPSDFSPVLYGNKYDADTFFILLGGVQGRNWLPADQAAAHIIGATGYDVYTLAGETYQVYGYAPVTYPVYPGYFLSTDATLNETGMVGVVQGWQAAQRNVEELPPENELYKQVVVDWLAQAGVVNPQLGTIQIHRVDLEGDGSDEIFISATRVESQHTIQEGDHSIILMRKVIGNNALTIPILADLYTSLGYGNPFPCTYFIGNFIDLNRDGVLEVVVEYERWEGFGASVYQIDGQNVEEALGATCITP